MPKSHGYCSTHRKEYNSWLDMKSRCLNQNHKSYKNYGARGITICDEWLNDLGQFIADMGKCPDGFSLDRIDNDKGYSPDNCRWADKSTQSRNTRKSATGAGIYEVNGRFVVQIGVDGMRVHVGQYATLDEAISARKAAESRYWSEGEKPTVAPELPRNNTSGFKGVALDKRHNRWSAFYGGRGNRKHIGSFGSAEEAHLAREEWLRHHGIGGGDEVKQ